MKLRNSDLTEKLRLTNGPFDKDLTRRQVMGMYSICRPLAPVLRYRRGGILWQLQLCVKLLDPFLADATFVRVDDACDITLTKRANVNCF